MDFDAEAIANELFSKHDEFINAWSGGQIEVDRSSAIYRNYSSVGGSLEITEKFYPVTDERFRNFEDVKATCLDIFTPEYGYSILGCDANGEFLMVWSDIEDTISNTTMWLIDGSDWYIIFDICDFNCGPINQIGDIRVEVTPEGEIKAYRKRHIKAIAYKGAENLKSRLDWVYADIDTLTPYEVEEDSNDIEEVYTIVNTDDGWRIASVENTAFSEEADQSQDSEAVAVVRELTDDYLAYYRKLSGNGLEVDTSETLEKSETDEAGRVYHNTYYLVTDDDYPSYERIYSILDEDCVMEELVVAADDDEWCYYNANNFLQKDGSWYILKERYDNVGTIGDWNGAPWGVEVNGDVIKAVRTYTYSSDKNVYDVEVYFTIGKTDDGWRITDFIKQRVT